MRIRLYFDEDSARHSLARELRFRGADVITTREAGMAGRADEQQLEWAASNGRALYSGIVNASPLILLGKINRLELLAGLAPSLVIPAAVRSEILAGPDLDPAKAWIKSAYGSAHVMPDLCRTEHCRLPPNCPKK